MRPVPWQLLIVGLLVAALASVSVGSVCLGVVWTAIVGIVSAKALQERLRETSWNVADIEVTTDDKRPRAYRE
jgi:hypothetical protein